MIRFAIFVVTILAVIFIVYYQIVKIKNSETPVSRKPFDKKDRDKADDAKISGN